MSFVIVAGYPDFAWDSKYSVNIHINTRRETYIYRKINTRNIEQEHNVKNILEYTINIVKHKHGTTCYIHKISVQNV